eukprot:TRINITY_DN2092_c0_g1_i1.p2 TRINITY_DN2092_c0_g1~~TRINITY_DN2092_c0_g1_i1.p2  ORF type:complete len:112 (-),score=21.87 TRINITY_DN2092_c0_g1_i1:124-459(-)
MELWYPRIDVFQSKNIIDHKKFLESCDPDGFVPLHGLDNNCRIQNLIQSMCAVKPQNRPTIDEVLNILRRKLELAQQIAIFCEICDTEPVFFQIPEVGKKGRKRRRRKEGR